MSPLTLINAFPIGYLDHVNDQFPIANHVQNSVPALPETIAIEAGQLHGTGRSWIDRERLDSRNDSAPVFF